MIERRISDVTFSEADFDVFTIPGLEPRMNAIITTVRPKLTKLGELIAPGLSLLTGDEIFPHVAKHARRKVHAPNDTWVAWAANKKGYKMLPHFQVGMFATHLFAQFAIIYESPHKAVFAEALTAQLDQVIRIVPKTYRWSMDHMNPDSVPHADMTKESFTAMAAKLSSSKNSEVMVGIRLDRNDPVLQDAEKLYGIVLNTFETLMPLYQMSFPSA